MSTKTPPRRPRNKCSSSHLSCPSCAWYPSSSAYSTRTLGKASPPPLPLAAPPLAPVEGAATAPLRPPPPPPPPPVSLGDVVLHSYWRSSCSWRVRVALSFYGVEYAYARVNLLADEQRGLSEMGQVPRLDWSDAAGERHSLTQSLAILELLHEAASAPGRSLLPLGPVPRARAREIAEVINAGTQPLQNLGHMRAISALAAKDQGSDAGRSLGREAIAKGLAAAEKLAAANRDERFCVGSHSSVADLCVVPQLYNARRFEVDLQPYPRLRAVEAHAATLPYFQAAHPDAQPDAAKA
mmetsp:Transcript_19809/g.58991  ORF Transcript_19809/g.58991 Transcript_19809/m.58991 type:complete len:297 (-) Transcript_19809:475-1365(-)